MFSVIYSYLFFLSHPPDGPDVFHLFLILSGLSIIVSAPPSCLEPLFSLQYLLIVVCAVCFLCASPVAPVFQLFVVVCLIV